MNIEVDQIILGWSRVRDLMYSEENGGCREQDKHLREKARERERERERYLSGKTSGRGEPQGTKGHHLIIIIINTYILQRFWAPKTPKKHKNPSFFLFFFFFFFFFFYSKTLNKP